MDRPAIPLPPPPEPDDEWDRPLPRRRMPIKAQVGFIVSASLLGTATICFIVFDAAGSPARGIGFWLVLASVLSFLFGGAVLFWAWETWREYKRNTLLIEFVSRSLLTALCLAGGIAFLSLLIAFCSGSIRP
jgi:hypothetical protein